MMLDTAHKKPLVSIITPSLNQGAFIERTIQSVLSQDYPAIEYIVIDGGSTDNTLDVLRKYGGRLKWISESDMGQAHAVNKGLMAAQGEVIGWLNSDDIYYAGALAAAQRVFVENPGIDILYGMADHIDENDNVIEPYYNEEWDYARLKEICFISQPAVFFRKGIVNKFGLLDEDLRYCMDYEYWLRVGREIPFYYLKQKLAGSRLYMNTKTLGSAAEVHEEILKMFKRRFGKVPDRWIFAHANAAAAAKGLNRGSAAEGLRFAIKIFLVSVTDSLRLRRYVPLSMLKVMAGWFVNGIKRRLRRGE